MAYDDRLQISQKFELNGFPRVNKLKLVEMSEFVQIYIMAGEHHAAIRLDRTAIEKIIKYLQNVEIKG